ncbi:hypothetical protein YC2023_004628 [Brassica napus]
MPPRMPAHKFILLASATFHYEISKCVAQTAISRINRLFPDLKSGRCSSVVEARLLRFWEARNVKRGGELMSADLLFMEVNGTIIFVEITHVRCPPPAWLDGSNSSADLILRKPTWLPTLLVSLALCTTINCHNLDLFKQQKIVNALFPIRFPYVALDYEQEVETAKSSSAIKVMLRETFKMEHPKE